VPGTRSPGSPCDTASESSKRFPFFFSPSILTLFYLLHAIIVSSVRVTARGLFKRVPFVAFSGLSGCDKAVSRGSQPVYLGAASAERVLAGPSGLWILPFLFRPSEHLV